MAQPDGAAVMTGEAWRQFCARLAAVGDQLLEPGFPASPQDRAEGFRHLANQVACWMTYAVGSSDAKSPLLFRHNDLVYRWGGPNIDQNSRRTVISGQHKYRLSGSMGSCEEFAIQVKHGEMHTGDAGVTGTLWASELGLTAGDTFVITISADPADEPTLLINPTAKLLHVRDYYYQWATAEPAAFVLERTDQSGEPPAPLTPDRVSEMLEIAATQVETSISYWRDYQEQLRSESGVNAFSPPGLVAEGVADMFYAHAFIRLEPDEAFVVTVSPVEAAHWNLQLYNRGWYESLDFANRLTHTNEALVETRPDGTADLVISAVDPGVANWLDTEGRAELMATSRWTRPASTPSIDARVVRLEDLPAPTVTPDQRRAQIDSRRAHVAWRYHT
jgi:hypothetical protein